jgi:probable O-glycosylation ligase (exosortase A-associated)
MMVPLFRYVQLNSGVKLVRVGSGIAMGLDILSALGSYSRGAMLALSATLMALLAQTRRRVLIGGVVALAFGGALLLLPEAWFERMSTLGEVREGEVDASTQGRFEIWAFSTQVALDRPLTGGGFDMLYDIGTFNMYGSTIRPRTAHSIIFQVLGEHGFVGLGLFLAIGLSLWLKGFSIKRACRGHPQLQWAADLASMSQVSLVGYFVAGLFINVAYFDLIYLFVPLMVGTAAVVAREQKGTVPVRRPGVTPIGVAGEQSKPALGLRHT